MAVLDNPVWAALTGPDRRVAEIRGDAGRYAPDVAPFAALADPHDPSAWADLAALSGPGATIVLPGDPVPPPVGWESLGQIDGVQMVDAGLDVAPDAEAVALGADDVPEMLALVARTQPGPFLPRTVELGNYLGVRDGGALIAMAGERMHPPGWAELERGVHRRGLPRPRSRHPSGEGGGRRCPRSGRDPFLHAAATNIGAIRLYLALGFELRREITFLVVRAPGQSSRS